jgi:hypothetical protein
MRLLQYGHAYQMILHLANQHHSRAPSMCSGELKPLLTGCASVEPHPRFECDRKGGVVKLPKPGMVTA